MEYCKICSRELEKSFDDPLEKVEGKICHRCFLWRAQKAGKLELSWDIKTADGSLTDIGELGMMAVYLAFADTELLEKVKEKIKSDPNPVLEQESKNRVVRVIDAALRRSS